MLNGRTGRVEDVDWPLEREIREILARRKEFDPEDRDAINVWDTSLQTMFFDRMISGMASFFRVVGLVTLALGGIGVMNIMLIAVKDRTREIGVRKALGATTAAIQRQFFLEGFFLTMISGGLGMMIGVALCTAVNVFATLPMRFTGWSSPGQRPARPGLPGTDRHRLVHTASAACGTTAAHRSAPLRDVTWCPVFLMSCVPES